jgi:membrane protein
MMPGIAATAAATRRRATRLLERTLLATWRACREFVEDRGHRDAAQIGFFAMLSAIPLALLLVGAFGWPLDEDEVREQVIRTVFDAVPLSTEEDRDRLESTTRDALDGAGRLGPFSILLLVAAASGVMSALRHAINQAWDIQARPPLLRRKALDVALVLGATVVLALALSVTATRRAERFFNDDSAVLGALFDALGDVLPFVFTGAVILGLYRWLPMQRQRVREIWPGALVATVLLAVVKAALELYFERLADLGALYGSLGALMALLLFVYAGSLVLVFGAEFASEWSRLPPPDEVHTIVGDARRRVRGAIHRRRRAWES